MKRDQAKQLADDALQELEQALQAGRSETLLQYLDVMGRFHNYSWNNCLMIARQNPEATFVAGFRRWLQLGRHVRKGEQGIGILAPMSYRKKSESDDSEETTVSGIRGFKVVHVFDVSQTEGDDLPELAPIRGNPAELLGHLEALIRNSGITLTYEPLPPGTQGISRKGEISVTQGLTSAENFAVLVHEVAHERLHDKRHRQQLSKTVLETEAEAVAYVVCRAFGLDCSTRSSDYIQLYRGDADTLTKSLDVIQQTSTQLIRELSATEPNPQKEEQRHVA